VTYVREATFADVPRLIEMACAFHAASPYGKLLPATPERLEVLVRLTLTQGCALVAVHDGQVVGMLGLLFPEHPFTGERFAEELAWWVEPSCRSLRAGPQLLAAAEAVTTRYGISVLKLSALNPSRVGDWLTTKGYEATETSFVKDLGRHDGRILQDDHGEPLSDPRP